MSRIAVEADNISNMLDEKVTEWLLEYLKDFEKNEEWTKTIDEADLSLIL